MFPGGLTPSQVRGQPNAAGSGARAGFRRIERSLVTMARRQSWLPRSFVTRTPSVVSAWLVWLEGPSLPGWLSLTLQDMLTHILPARSRVPFPRLPDEPACASHIRRRSRLHRTFRQGCVPCAPAKDHVVRDTQGAFHRGLPVTGMGTCTVNRASHQEPRGRLAFVHRLFPACG